MGKRAKEEKKINWQKGLLICTALLFVAVSALSCFLYVKLNEAQADGTIKDTAILTLTDLLSENKTELETIKAEMEQIDQSLEIQFSDMGDKDARIKELEEMLLRKEQLTAGNTVSFAEEDLFEKIVYLTFDDGPSYNTMEILEILDRESVKATFFVIYSSYANTNNLYKEIVDRGHAIGNHTYDHVIAQNNWTVFYESFFKMEDYIFEQTGIRTDLVRFPGGSKSNWSNSEKNKAEAIKLFEMGYTFFDWNVINNDANSDAPEMTADEMVEYVINGSRGRDKIILLMHDRNNKNTTVAALEDIIQYYKSKGYVFLPLTKDSFKVQFFKAVTKDPQEG